MTALVLVEVSPVYLVITDDVATGSFPAPTFTQLVFDTPLPPSLIFSDAGVQGPPGGSSSSPQVMEVGAATSGAQSYALPAGVVRGLLYVNGLIQGGSNYTVAANTLTIPASMGLLAGDFISFLY